MAGWLWNSRHLMYAVFCSPFFHYRFRVVDSVPVAFLFLDRVVVVAIFFPTVQLCGGKHCLDVEVGPT